MRKRWSRTATIALLLSVPAFGVAVSALQGARFSDIPAGHWATEAVEYVTTQGLIQGYPDQTFKGGRTLTRYEAATIFYRLLRSGNMANASPQGQELIQKGLAEVQDELKQVQAKLGTLEATNGETATRLSTLEQQIKNLPAPAAAGPDLEPRLKALEDQVKTIADRPAATPPAPAGPDLEPRLKALEDQVKAIADRPAATPPAPAGPDLEPRLKALEDQVKTLANAPAAPASNLEPRVAALEERLRNPAASTADAGQDTKIAALETQVKDLSAELADLKSQVGKLTAAPPPAPPAPPPPAAAPPPPTPPVDVTPPPPPPPAPRNFTIGLGASLPVLPTFSTSNISLAGFVGFKRLIGPVGVRANFDLNLGAQTLSIGPDLILTIGSGGFLEPYVGVGAGGVFGVQNSLFIRGILGLNLNFSPLLGLWLEGDPRFSPFQTNGFSFSVRGGLKLSL
jgi:hypothetical protein